MLDIVYRDDDLLAVHKPAGLLVHRSALDAGETRTVVDLLRAQLGCAVWPVHRLDKGTSGVLLLALHAGAASRLAAQFEAGEAVRKTYLAVVRGWPPAQGAIDHPLRRLADDARPGRCAVQSAQTLWRTLEHYALPLPYGDFPTTRCALVALQPLTGRRHQLRRHMKHIAHPVIGDATHGKGALNRAVAALLGLQRLWLHASELTLLHPRTGEPLRLQAPPGPAYASWAPYRVPL